MPQDKSFAQIIRPRKSKVIVFVVLFLIVTLVPCVRETSLTPYAVRVQPIVIYLAFIEDTVSNFYDNMALGAIFYAIAFTLAYSAIYVVSCVIVEFTFEQIGAFRK